MNTAPIQSGACDPGQLGSHRDHRLQVRSWFINIVKKLPARQQADSWGGIMPPEARLISSLGTVEDSFHLCHTPGAEGRARFS